MLTVRSKLFQNVKQQPQMYFQMIQVCGQLSSINQSFKRIGLNMVHFRLYFFWKSDKHIIIFLGPDSCRNTDLIMKQPGIRNFTEFHLHRTLPNGAKIDRDWLIYSPSTDSIYCFVCRLFGNLLDNRRLLWMVSIIGVCYRDVLHHMNNPSITWIMTWSTKCDWKMNKFLRNHSIISSKMKCPTGKKYCGELWRSSNFSVHVDWLLVVITKLLGQNTMGTFLDVSNYYANLILSWNNMFHVLATKEKVKLLCSNNVCRVTK